MNNKRRFRMSLITMLLVVPMLVITVYAAFNINLNAFKVDGIAVSATNSGDGEATAKSANKIYLKVNAGSLGTKYAQLKFEAQAEGTLTFDCNVTYVSTMKINGKSAGTSSLPDCSYDLKQGESVTIYINPKNGWSGSSKKNGEITIENIAFERANSTVVKFNTPVGSGATGVTYTVNGKAVSGANTEVNLTQETEMKAVFSGIPSGYAIREWRLPDGTRYPYANMSADCKTINRPGEDVTDLTLTPVIEKAGTPIFMVNNKNYYTWEEAFTAAGATGTVVMSGNGTLPATVETNGTYAKMVDGKAVYTIDVGQTLLLPRVEGRTDIAADTADLPYANYGIWASDSRWRMNPENNRYLKLEIPANVTLNNNGKLILGGTIASGEHYFAGGTLCQDEYVADNTHSDMVLNGTLNMGNNAVLSTLGFITGSGNLNATNTGAKIYQPFVIVDYRGGNYVLGASGKIGSNDYGYQHAVGAGSGSTEEVIAPFARYTMQNIQTNITLNASNYMIGYIDLLANDTPNLTNATIIGDKNQQGLITLAENAYIKAKYQDSNKVEHYDAFKSGDPNEGTRGGIEGWGYDQIGRTKLEIFNGASVGTLDLKVKYSGSVLTVTTEGKTFPVPYNYDIYLNNGDYNIGYSMMLLPGASMTVNSGATLNITGSNTRFMVMDGLFDHTRDGVNAKELINGNPGPIDTAYRYTIDYTYPKTGELQAAGLSGTAELKLNGGDLMVGTDVMFGGLVQTNGSASSRVNFNGISGCDIRIGVVGNGTTTDYSGATVRTLPARLMNGAGKYVEMINGGVYKAAADDNNAITEYKFYLHTSYDNKKIKSEITEVAGKTCDNCETCQLKYGSEKARCVCNIFSPIAVSGMWYDYTLTVKEAGKADVVYYHLNNKLYTADGEVTAHTIGENYGAKVTSGSGVEVATEGTTLTFSNVALTSDTVVTVCTHEGAVETPEVPATCEGIGTKAYWTCECGKIYEDEACTVEITDLASWKVNAGKLPATGHTEVADAAVDATCTTTGLTEGKHCSVCGEVLVAQNVVNALGHTEVADAAVDATCTATGRTEGKHCSVCGEVLVAQTVVNALGHTEVTDDAVAPTCTDAGLTEGKHCSVCNEVLVAQNVVDALGHNYMDGTCGVCGEEDPNAPDEPDECEHSNIEYTDNGNGTHTVTCSECDVVVDDAEEHTDTDSDGVCDSCEAELVLIDPNLTVYRADATVPYAKLMVGSEIKIYVNVKKSSQYTEYYAEFAINNNGIKTTQALPSDSSNGTYANFRFAVPAPLMTETISATIYGVKNGVVYRGNPVEFTVQESVFTQLDNAYKAYDANPKAPKQIDLLLSMLKYGAEAQLQFKRNTDNLAIDGLKAEYVELMKTNIPEFRDYPPVDESGQEVVLSKMSLMLQEKINMYGNFKFAEQVTDLTGYAVVIEHTKSNGEMVSYTIDHEDLTLSGKYITFYFDKIAPSQMRDEMAITLYRNGKAVSATYIRTGDMIVKNVLSGNVALRDAIMNYADFAKVYFEDN